MGRLHGSEGPARAMAASREAGIDNVSVDLIFGVPERLGRDWAADLDAALALLRAHYPAARRIGSVTDRAGVVTRAGRG
jgi:oxygen-independent coproporphyrinogen-3 oxidase